MMLCETADSYARAMKSEPWKDLLDKIYHADDLYVFKAAVKLASSLLESAPEELHKILFEQLNPAKILKKYNHKNNDAKSKDVEVKNLQRTVSHRKKLTRKSRFSRNRKRGSTEDSPDMSTVLVSVDKGKRASSFLSLGELKTATPSPRLAVIEYDNKEDESKGENTSDEDSKSPSLKIVQDDNPVQKEKPIRKRRLHRRGNTVISIKLATESRERQLSKFGGHVRGKTLLSAGYFSSHRITVTASEDIRKPIDLDKPNVERVSQIYGILSDEVNDLAEDLDLDDDETGDDVFYTTSADFLRNSECGEVSNIEASKKPSLHSNQSSAQVKASVENILKAFQRSPMDFPESVHAELNKLVNYADRQKELPKSYYLVPPRIPGEDPRHSLVSLTPTSVGSFDIPPQTSENNITLAKPSTQPNQTSSGVPIPGTAGVPVPIPGAIPVPIPGAIPVPMPVNNCVPRSLGSAPMPDTINCVPVPIPGGFHVPLPSVSIAPVPGVAAVPITVPAPVPSPGSTAIPIPASAPIPLPVPIPGGAIPIPSPGGIAVPVPGSIPVPCGDGNAVPMPGSIPIPVPGGAVPLPQAEPIPNPGAIPHPEPDSPVPVLGHAQPTGARRGLPLAQQQWSIRKKKKRKPSKPKVKQKEKMKAFHWDRLLLWDEQQVGTVWHMMPDPAVYFQEYEDEFVDQFRLKVVKKKKEKAPGGKRSGAGTKAKKEVVSILAGRRQQSLMILTAKLPKAEDLIRQILHMENLSAETVEGLIKHQPQPEEMQSIESTILTDNQVWGEPEQLLIALWSVPKLNVRLECWIFIFEFENNLQRIQDCCDCHNEACLQLVQSETLHDILSLLLTCGNYMNANNKRKGRADGFKIDLLLKLDCMKGRSKSETFLHFIARIAKKRIPNCELLNQELCEVVHAAAGSTQTLQEMKAECMQLSASFKKVELAQKFPRHNDDDLFSEKCRAFVEEKREEVETMMVVLDHTINNFNRTLRFFSWKCALDESPSFFKIFTQFASSFLKAMPQLKFKKTDRKKKYKKGERIDSNVKDETQCEPLGGANSSGMPAIKEMTSNAPNFVPTETEDVITPKLRGLLRRCKRKDGKRGRKKESIRLKTIENEELTRPKTIENVELPTAH